MKSSEHNLSLDVVLLSEDESFASLDNSEAFCLGLGAFEFEHNLLGVLGLLSEDGFGLSSETLLFHVISSFSLGNQTGFAGLVLGHFVDRVLMQFSAVTSNRLWDMYHFAFYP